ncbi:hypothetical protein [Aquimarina macrocephali]|uniref:hypothetical protein n=1 Tax=Aquimarina macrocephali TaxID=666563 RepID=UPI0004661F93|nr:hypothetical protein [Aquimarina macrocephali]
MLKKFLTNSILILLIPISVISQTTPGKVLIYSENGKLKYQIKNSSLATIKKGIITKTDLFKYATEIKAYFNEEQLNKDSGTTLFRNCKDFTEGKLNFKYNCNNNYVELWINGKDNDKYTIWYCDRDENWKFTTDEEEYKKCKNTKAKKPKTSNKDSVTTSYKDITEIPKPDFQSRIRDTLFDKQNRFLLIDANPNPNYSSSVRLVKRRKVDNNGSFLIKDKEAKAVSTKGNISVFLKNYNITELENITVTINNRDYEYNTGLGELVNPKTPDDKETEAKKPEDSIKTVSTPVSPIEARTAYLKEFYNKLQSIDHLNTNDIARLENYKNTLKTVKENQDLDIELNDKGTKLYEKILSYSPLWVGLTPIAPAVKDTDEIEISASIEYENKPKNDIFVGHYKTIGGLAVDIGGNFFLTGLRNNKIFTDSVTVGDTKELRAKIGNKNQRSLGYGLNAEVSLRTGSLLRPTINIGSFIPFEEDISPYFALGPGVSLVSKKVKIRFAAGIAYGKVNAIAEQYRDRDLSDFENLTNESLTEKVWDSSWYISVGIRYVFNKKED